MGFFSWGHWISCQHGIFFKMPCGKKKSHVDMGFLSKRHVGKKSHVDMRFSRAHVNMRFFSQHGVLKKSHVNMEHLFLMLRFFLFWSIRPLVAEDACRLAKTHSLFSRLFSRFLPLRKKLVRKNLVLPPSQKLANLLTEVKLTKYWISTHCRKIQEFNPLLV